jgi:hypothetical protein
MRGDACCETAVRFFFPLGGMVVGHWIGRWPRRAAPPPRAASQLSLRWGGLRAVPASNRLPVLGRSLASGEPPEEVVAAGRVYNIETGLKTGAHMFLTKTAKTEKKTVGFWYKI